MDAQEQGRVLLVDDSAMERIRARTWLKDAGYDVTEATDGLQALELAIPEGRDEDAPFDLVILDVLMPQMDGITALQKLRERFSAIELPVIMATGQDDRDDVVRGLHAGANDYIAKPVDQAILLARLKTQLSLKHSHEALRQAQRSLIRSAKMETIGHLAAGVAHEIRNPLAQIQMAVEALGDRVDPSDEDAKFLVEAAIENVAKSDEIVRDLMRVSKEAQLQLVPGDLATLTREALALFQGELESKHIRVALEAARDLPEVDLAPDEMRQVIMSLIQNATHAMPDGGELRLQVSPEVLQGLPPAEGSRTGNRPRNGDEVVIVAIEDTGPGIPEDILMNVFDAFYTTKATGDATGLGLTIARKIVDLHRGLISIANRDPGPGARAVVTLPVRKRFRTAV